MRATLIHRSLPLALAVALAACGSSGTAGSTQTKSGGVPAPVPVRIGTSQASGVPATAPLGELARQLEDRSGGSLEPEIRYELHEDDASVIADLRSGAVDLAAVPARAWSAAGATSMAALQAPFVIRSEEHLNAVAQDSEVAAQVFAGLDPLGVTGLAMYPDGLRHFFSLDGTPIRSPDDLKGRTVRGPASADTEALVSVLGASLVSADVVEGTNDGTITAGETGYFGAVNEYPSGIVATGNVVPYTKMVVLAASSAFVDRLTGDQRSALREAALAAASWSIANHATEAEDAARFCELGGSIVEATGEELAAFGAAVQPLLDGLRQDPSTGAVIDGLEALAPPTDPTPPTCPASGAVARDAGPTAEEIVADGGGLPNGTYRVELTEEVLRRYSDGNPEKNAGTLTFRLEDGHWTVEFPASDGSIGQETGIYQVIGQDLYWQYLVSDPPPFGRSAHLTWELDADGSILWTQVAPPFKDYLFGVPWVRVSG